MTLHTQTNARINKYTRYYTMYGYYILLRLNSEDKSDDILGNSVRARCRMVWNYQPIVYVIYDMHFESPYI